MEDREYNRLLNLIESARKYNYWNYIINALMAVLLLKDSESELSLFLELTFQVKYLLIFLFTVSVVFTILSLDILISIWKPINIGFDDEVTFNWFAISGKKSRILSGFWVVLPWIIGAISISLSNVKIDKPTLIILAIIVISYPNYLKEFFFNISKRVDEDGYPITFSIYCLYWYRLFRGIAVTFIMSISIIVFFSNRTIVLSRLNAIYLLTIIILIFLLRLIWEFNHKKIDKWGVKFGFVEKYEKNSPIR